MSLSNGQKQLILFTKGWFKDKKEDSTVILQKIVGKSWKINIEFVSDQDIYNFVINTYFKLRDMELITISEKDFLKFHVFNQGSKQVSQMEMTKKLLSWISNIETTTIELENPDYLILF